MPGRKSFPARLAVQVAQIKAEFAADGIVVHNHPVGAPDQLANFLFRAGRVLARTKDENAPADAPDDAALVRTGLQRSFTENEILEEQIAGLTAFTLTGPRAAVFNLDAFISDLNKQHQRVVASFDHILHVTGACCPASEPELVGGGIRELEVQPVPPVNTNGQTGQGVKVAVIDTGILTKVVTETDPAHPWLTTPTAITGEDEPNKAGVYTGHGTFVAGVLRCIAPGANVRVYSILGPRGAVSETELVPRVIAALKDFNPDIVSMSAGTRTTGDNILLSFEVLREKLKEAKAVLVCAAGNDGDFGPFVPASLDWPEAVAVGALEENGTMAPYSNHGPAGHDWVDVYARGSDVVNAYPNGPYVYSQPPRGKGADGSKDEVNFKNGMASWSGTSFSTPIVAGIIAVRMKGMDQAQTPMKAAEDLKKIALANAANHGGLPTLTLEDALKNAP